jgi:hypothetical protein
VIVAVEKVASAKSTKEIFCATATPRFVRVVPPAEYPVPLTSLVVVYTVVPVAVKPETV